MAEKIALAEISKLYVEHHFGCRNSLGVQLEDGVEKPTYKSRRMDASFGADLTSMDNIEYSPNSRP